MFIDHIKFSSFQYIVSSFPCPNDLLITYVKIDYSKAFRKLKYTKDCETQGRNLSQDYGSHRHTSTIMVFRPRWEQDRHTAPISGEGNFGNFCL